MFNFVHFIFPKILVNVFFGKDLIERSFNLSCDEFVSYLSKNSSGLLISLSQKTSGTQIEIEKNLDIFVNGFKTRFVGVISSSKCGGTIKGKFRYALLPKIFIILGIGLLINIVYSIDLFLPALLFTILGIHFLGFMIKFVSMFNMQIETSILNLIDGRKLNLN